MLQGAAPAKAGHDYVFSADVKIRMFQRFCTEEAAVAFLTRNLWIDKYIWQNRRRAEKLVTAGDNPHEGLRILSCLWVYINQKSEVPFKVCQGLSTTVSAWRIIRREEDDCAIDEIMEFARSIALARLETGAVRIDQREGWELVSAAVNAV